MKSELRRVRSTPTRRSSVMSVALATVLCLASCRFLEGTEPATTTIDDSAGSVEEDSPEEDVQEKSSGGWTDAKHTKSSGGSRKGASYDHMTDYVDMELASLGANIKARLLDVEKVLARLLRSQEETSEALNDLKRTIPAPGARDGTALPMRMMIVHKDDVDALGPRWKELSADDVAERWKPIFDDDDLTLVRWTPN